MAFNFKGTRNGAARNLVSVLIGNTKTIRVGDVVESFTGGSLTTGVAAAPLKGFVHAIVEAENGVKPSLPQVKGSNTAGVTNPSDQDSVTTAADNTTTKKFWAIVDTSLDSLYSAEVNGTIDTTNNSGDLGARINVDSANSDVGRVLESTATRTVATTANFYSHGLDPEDSARLVVSLAQSEEYSAPTTEA